MAQDEHGKPPEEQGGEAGPPAARVDAGCMPPWEVDELPRPPLLRIDPRRLIGPGLMMAGAAIGGGEWLTGPALTAQYGGALMWIATVSILMQCAYNLEVMRYTLYCGEPIFVGFFRTFPGPRFWTVAYLILDFGAIWPYLSANAAVPLVAAFLGHLPGSIPVNYSAAELVSVTGLATDVAQEAVEHPNRFGPLDDVEEETGLPGAVLRQMAQEPERFGGTPMWKPYPEALGGGLGEETAAETIERTGLSAEIVQELRRNPDRFGTVEQVVAATGLPAELVERMAASPGDFGSTGRWKPYPEAIVTHFVEPEDRLTHWVAYAVFLASFVPLIFGGKIYNALEKVMVAKIFLVLGYLTFLGIFYVDWPTWAEIFSGFLQFGRLPVVDGEQLTWGAFFGSYFRGESPPIDLALLATFAAIAGVGGLSNTNFSAYAREKGWGMGPQVGAIPSAIGGTGIKLSHNGKVFEVNEESKRRWRGWRFVTFRDQIGVWVIACILGMGIPSLVSLQFVRGQDVRGNALAAMTAQGVIEQTGVGIFWFLTLLCGFLVLAPSQVSTIDGIIRRWTDVIWTGGRWLRHLGGEKVKYVYYGMLSVYAAWGVVALWLIPNPIVILKVSGVLMNFALGFSSLHTLWVNCRFLPKQLRPSWFMRLCLVACAVFFIGISAVSIPSLIQAISESAR